MSRTATNYWGFLGLLIWPGALILLYLLGQLWEHIRYKKRLYKVSQQIRSLIPQLDRLNMEDIQDQVNELTQLHKSLLNSIDKANLDKKSMRYWRCGDIFKLN